MTSKESFICYKCNKTFLTKNGLSGHSKIHKSTIIDIDIDKDKNKNCEYCQKIFKFKYLLKSHMEECPNKNVYLLNKITEDYKELHEKYISYQQESKKELEELQNKYLTYQEEYKKELELIKNDNEKYCNEIREQSSKYDNLSRKHDKTESSLKELQTKYLLMENTCKHYKEFYEKHTQQLGNNITIDQRSINNTHIQSDVINIVKDFIPLTPQFIYEQMKDISAKKLAHIGVKYIGTHAINSKIGENVVVTDASRKVCSYIDQNNQIVKDPYCNNLTQLILDETSKSENIKLAIEIAKEVGSSELIDPKYQSKIVKNCIDIQKVEQNVSESSINSEITNQIAKQASTTEHSKKNEQKRIQKKVNKI
jgi:hypothetical protein